MLAFTVFDLDLALDSPGVAEVCADDARAFEEDHDDGAAAELSVEALHTKLVVTALKRLLKNSFVLLVAELRGESVVSPLDEVSKGEGVLGPA